MQQAEISGVLCECSTGQVKSPSKNLRSIVQPLMLNFYLEIFLHLGGEHVIYIFKICLLVKKPNKKTDKRHEKERMRSSFIKVPIIGSGHQDF